MVTSSEFERGPRPGGMAAAGLLALAVGQAAGGVSLQYLPPPAGNAPFPPWVFAAVWTVLFPCWGVASAHVWAARPRREAALALAVGVCALAMALAFMPIAGAAREPWVTAGMDALALVVTWIAGWSYARVSRRAARWLLPLVLWMPVTLAISVATALGG